MEYPVEFMACKAYTIELHNLRQSIHPNDLMRHVEVAFALRVMYYRLSKYQCVKDGPTELMISQFELAFPELQIVVPINQLRHKGCQCKNSEPINLNQVEALAAMLNSDHTDDQIIVENTERIELDAQEHSIAIVQEHSIAVVQDEQEIVAQNNLDECSVDNECQHDEDETLTPCIDVEHTIFPGEEEDPVEINDSNVFDVIKDFRLQEKIVEVTSKIDTSNERFWNVEEVQALWTKELKQRPKKITTKIKRGQNISVIASIETGPKGHKLCVFYHGLLKHILTYQQVFDFEIFSNVVRKLPLTQESVISLLRIRLKFLQCFEGSLDGKKLAILERKLKFLKSEGPTTQDMWRRVNR